MKFSQPKAQRKGVKMDWYKFDIAAFRQATQQLNMREEGVYRRLLDRYYTLEGPLINDLRRLKQELNCVDRWDHQALIKVLSTYFILDASTNLYHNKKADTVIADYKERQDKNRVNANARWNGANRNASGNASAMPIQTNIYIKKEDACCALLENGQKCGKPGHFGKAGKWHCQEHGLI